MDNPFFTALEGDGFDSRTLAKNTNDVLMPFMHYLNNSIKALESKEVSCEWKPITKTSYRLKPNKRVWRVTPVTEIEVANDKDGWLEILSEADGSLLDEQFSPNVEEPVYVGKGVTRKSYPLNTSDFRKVNQRFEIYLPELDHQEVINWTGYLLSVRPLAVPLDQLKTVHVDGQVCRVIKQAENKLSVEGLITSNSIVTVNSQGIDFRLLRPVNDSLLNKYQSKREGIGWLVFSGVKPSPSGFIIDDVTQATISGLSLAHFEYNGAVMSENSWSMEIDRDEMTLIALSNELQAMSGHILCSILPEIIFSIEPRKGVEKWIQLIEKVDAGTNQGKSDLDYFFTDNQNIKLLDSTQYKNDDGFRVLKTRPEERQILLAKNIKGKKNWNSDYPNSKGKNHDLRVSVDTSQLKRQKEAINQLKSRPNIGHKPLAHLLQDRTVKNWKDVELPEIGDQDWHVLTDPDFDGCISQREFVRKALASEDFTILDGPPGTGKTTSILELIIQLVLEGKRVLLSASTHAAINNVLERIKENTILSQNIFPLRIGYETNAIGVEDYQFDNQFELLKSLKGCTDFSKQLLVDSSNLVCGTTNGILKLFREDGVTLDRGEPPFDVMIIDECSKTTFHEFLVPARFAKRWVLVGDVRQLSPFTDREQIVANLDNLMLEPSRGNKPEKTLSSALQQACFLLEELRGDNNNPYGQPVLVPVNLSVLNAIVSELDARKKEFSITIDDILVIAKSTVKKNTDKWLQNLASIKQEPWRLYASNLCFVDEKILNDIQYLIPTDTMIVHENWQTTHHAMLHKNKGSTVKAFEIKANTYTDSILIYKNLLERFNTSKWSEELCWRLERDYWLRLSADHKKKTRNISKTIDRLLPKSIDIVGRIHVLKSISFPSILEALSGDGLERRKKDGATTLNQGFEKNEKRKRHTTLDYQHRMHPDISIFPRKQFYPEGVLKDGRQTLKDRTWEYDRYQSHSVWLNVVGKVSGNANEKEVRKIIEELKTFCNWAQGKEKNNKGDPYDVAIITFYKGQEKAIRQALQKLPGNKDRYARFSYKGIAIKLATVDYFQGQEADLVFLSMVNTDRDGFLDSPNRLNVSVTRARYQLVIVGHNKYFSQSRTVELRNLATLQGIK
jgi:hypothetical protein